MTLKLKSELQWKYLDEYMCVLERPSQSTGLNTTEKPCNNLKCVQ